MVVYTTFSLRAVLVKSQSALSAAVDIAGTTIVIEIIVRMHIEPVEQIEAEMESVLEVNTPGKPQD